MENKFESGVSAVKRVKLIMEYSLNKTSVENLNEQTAYERYLDKTFADPKKAQEFLDANKEIINWFSTLDTHDWLTLISITTGILGMIPSPLSVPLLGISFIADISDATKYYLEGDKYTSGLLFALSIIPGRQLFSELKTAYTFKKIGTSGVKKLIAKSKAGTLTSSESKVLKKVVKELGEESDVLVKLTNQTVKQSILKNLGKQSLKFLINLLFLLKSVGVGVGKLGFQIGGIYYLWDELYLAIFANDIKELDVRKYGHVQQLVALIKKDENYFKDLLIHQDELLIEEATKKGVDLTPLKPTEKLSISLDKFKQKIKNKETIIQTPSIEMVVSKKIDPTTKKPYTLHKGQKGKSIHKVQEMLSKVGYEDMLAGFYETQTEAVDGFFGNNTELAVKEFQKDNNIPVDGIVGSQTLNLLIQKTK